jgi:hypothetical protein
MCQYKSAIVLANGDLVHHEATDNHEMLMAFAGLKDDTRQPNFVRVEYTSADLGDIDSYTLRVDQDFLPPWWTPELIEDVTRRLRALCERSIVSDYRKILLGGVWVLVKDAKVDHVLSARIVTMRDSARITNVRDSARITDVRDSARITDVRDSARITDVRDSARITNVGDSASITNVGDSASITDVGGSARITNVWGSASITDVGGSARITNVWGSARITNDHRLPPARREGGQA